MPLKKSDREALKMKFGGRCAYCGDELGARWHADHVEAIRRRSKYVRDRGFVPTGEMDRPENDCLANMMPACVPCNIDKHSFTIEQWRRKLAETCGVLQRNNPNYRHALRFGLVYETGAEIQFYFEKAEKANAVHASPPGDRRTGGVVAEMPLPTAATSKEYTHHG